MTNNKNDKSTWAIGGGILIEPTHKLKIDQDNLRNCKFGILNLVNVL